MWIHINNPKHKGQIHPYCYENVKKYLAQYGIELFTAEPKPDISNIYIGMIYITLRFILVAN